MSKNHKFHIHTKTCDISCFLQFCQFLPLLETLSQILFREDHKESSYHQSTCQDATFNVWQGGILNKKFSISRRWIEDPQEDRTGGKQWNFEKYFIYRLRQTRWQSRASIELYKQARLSHWFGAICTLHKGPKRHNICRILFPNDRNQTFCQDIECHTNFRQF